MKIDIKNYVTAQKEKIRDEIANDIRIHGPSLLILQVGNLSASNSQVTRKLKDCEEVGIQATLYKVTEKNAFTKLRSFLKTNKGSYSGIILQEPCGLAEGDRRAILDMIEPSQDVDGFKIDSWFYPCTPLGILDILEEFYHGDGKVITVVGRGALVGKPLIPMLIEEGWTVLCANSRTPDLKALTSMSDVVVTATGCRSLIKRDMLKDGAFVIDAGITCDENGKLCGDCDKSLYDDETIQITTVPGGVGLMTRLSLIKNVMEAWKK